MLAEGGRAYAVSETVVAVFDEVAGPEGQLVKSALGQVLDRLALVGERGAELDELLKDHPRRKIAVAILDVAGAVVPAGRGRLRLAPDLLGRLHLLSAPSAPVMVS